MNPEIKKPVTLGVDLGGTKCATALVDARGHVLSTHNYPTHPEKGADRIIDDVAACKVALRELVSECIK